MSNIAAVHALPRNLVLEADTVTVYRMDAGPRAGAMVIEVTDAHGTVLGRTITEGEGTRQDVADSVLDRSPLQRCSDWTTHPIGKGKRLIAMVTLAVSSNPGTLRIEAAQHSDSAATA